MLARSEQSACYVHVEAPCAALRMNKWQKCLKAVLPWDQLRMRIPKMLPQMRTNIESCLRLFLNFINIIPDCILLIFEVDFSFLHFAFPCYYFCSIWIDFWKLKWPKVKAQQWIKLKYYAWPYLFRWTFFVTSEFLTIKVQFDMKIIYMHLTTNCFTCSWPGPHRMCTVLSFVRTRRIKGTKNVTGAVPH